MFNDGANTQLMDIEWVYATVINIAKCNTNHILIFNCGPSAVNECEDFLQVTKLNDEPSFVVFKVVLHKGPVVCTEM